ncbi:MAG TPA: universal stress protein [Micromonosporaceae bacterium]|nr:universal stress protein [Micromonosporaceae bacterium]
MSNVDVPGAGSDLIVVGVSAGTGSGTALRWAVEEAKRRDGRVRAVMAWRVSPAPGAAGGRPPAQKIMEYNQQQIAQETVEDFVADALGDDHQVQCIAVEGPARTVLVSESRDAALLVVDSPRMAKLTSPGARRLAPRLLFRAACPVVVMPAPAHSKASVVPQSGAYVDHGAAESADVRSAASG